MSTLKENVIALILGAFTVYFMIAVDPKTILLIGFATALLTFTWILGRLILTAFQELKNIWYKN